MTTWFEDTADMTRSLCAALREQRIARGLTLAALVGDSELRIAQVSEWERGGKTPTLASLVRWADRLGYDLTLVLTQREGAQDKAQVQKAQEKMQNAQEEVQNAQEEV